jgi:hypothetical protein
MMSLPAEVVRHGISSFPAVQGLLAFRQSNLGGRFRKNDVDTS